jgi:membrane associated rhomboid family serine protease
MDRDGGQIRFALPRPGLGVKLVLGIVAVFAILNAVLISWVPSARNVWQLFVVEPDGPVWQMSWRLLTAGFVTAPRISHVLTALMGLYFLSPDLEKAWGTTRYLAFTVGSSAAGLALGVVLNRLAFASEAPPPADFTNAGLAFAADYARAGFLPAHFHQGVLFGPYVMIAATGIAWARMRPGGQIFLYFFPVSTRVFMWFTVALAASTLVFPAPPPEGVLGPLAGVGVGFLFSGSPSPMRRLWLRIRLAFYRRQSRALLEQSLGTDRPTTKRRPGAPPLRVVSGGLEDELKKRKPPKDKRYLN